MEETVLICEDSMESIFTAIYQTYEWRLNRNQVFLQLGEEENLRLFADYRKVETDEEKAKRTASAIIRKMGKEVYWDVCCVLAAEDSQKAQAVYRTVVTALDKKQYKDVMSDIRDPYIQKAFELARAVSREMNHLKGFLRFQELENGVLYGKIGPKNNIAAMLLPHFQERYPLENFIIHDDVRQIFVLHPAKREAIILKGNEFTDFQLPGNSKKEDYYQELFAEFCHTIAIKERENLVLQRNMLPLRFQEYMVEFQKK